MRIDRLETALERLIPKLWDGYFKALDRREATALKQAAALATVPRIRKPEVLPLRHPSDVIERWARGGKLPVTEEMRQAWETFDGFMSATETSGMDAAQWMKATSDLRRQIVAAYQDGAHVDEICRTVAVRATPPEFFGRRSWGSAGAPYWDGLHPSPSYVESVIEAYGEMQAQRVGQL